MSFLKNVLHDLVEKRLWPVAIALVAALVAVPILLGGSSPEAATPVDVAAATTTNGLANHRDVAREQVISLEEQAAGKVERKGKVLDPFVQHHQPKPAKLVSTAAKTVSSALSGATTTTSTGGGTGGTSDTTTTTTSAPTPTTTTPTTTTKKPDSTSVDAYRVKLSFGEVGAQKSYDNVARLTPLPSSDNPFFVYLGLADDQKSAVFLINADAVPNGDGHCTPSPSDCQQITLKAGDTEFFDLQSGTAGVVQYQLDLKSIHKYKAATKASAAKAHARESKAGREALRQLVADDPTALSSWDYSKSLGLLVQKDPATTPDVANVPSSIADEAAGAAVGQTSTVLTVPTAP